MGAEGRCEKIQPSGHPSQAALYHEQALPRRKRSADRFTNSSAESFSFFLSATNDGQLCLLEGRCEILLGI